MITKLIFIVFISLILHTHALTQDKERINQTKIITGESIQLIKLTEQNILLKKSIDDNKSILLWALGFAGTFLVAFLGVNIYFIKSEKTTNLNNITKYIEESKIKIEENKLSVFNLLKEENNKTIENKIKSFEARFNQTASSISTKIDKIELTILKNNVHGEDRNHPITIYDLIYLGKKIIEIDDVMFDYETGRCLEQITAFVNKKPKLFPEETAKMVKYLNGLPSSFSVTTNSIIQKLNNLEY
ncbi:MAG: hypothetical protein COA79_22465 [Planctomycetota bacterium]|nr:MAG: hypothetical protein COA79_22465 [Planctomycetota bacterium]